MLVLGIESATNWCGVALWDDAGPVASRAFVNHMELSARLVPTIQRMLREEDLRFADLGGIAVSTGPGSFTGLRIGVATAKTLAQAAGLPIAGVGTMDAMAAPYGTLLECNTRLVLTLSARRGQFYVRWQDAEEGGITVATTDELREALAMSDLPVLVLGDAALKYGVSGTGCPLPAVAHYPRAINVAALGHARLSRGDSDDLMALVPLYIGRSAAEERHAAG